jgi:hypothetical protein
MEKITEIEPNTSYIILNIYKLPYRNTYKIDYKIGNTKINLVNKTYKSYVSDNDLVNYKRVNIIDEEDDPNKEDEKSGIRCINYKVISINDEFIEFIKIVDKLYDKNIDEIYDYIISTYFNKSNLVIKSIMVKFLSYKYYIQDIIKIIYYSDINEDDTINSDNYHIVFSYKTDLTITSQRRNLIITNYKYNESSKLIINTTYKKCFDTPIFRNQHNLLSISFNRNKYLREVKESLSEEYLVEL